MLIKRSWPASAGALHRTVLLCVLMVASLAPLLPQALAAAQFSTSLDRDTIALGEKASLSLTFKGGSPRAMPSLPAIDGIAVVSTGTSINSSFDSNGQAQSELSYILTLAPTKAGEFKIPALQAEIGNQVLVSQPLTLKVIKPDASTAAQEQQLAFIKLVVPKKELFLGEPITVELQFFIRDGIANADAYLESFNAVPTPLKAEGFTVFKTVPAQLRRAQVSTTVYKVATLVSSLAPVKTGTLTLASTIEAVLNLQIPLPNQRARDPFDPFDFFNRVRVEQRQVPISVEPQTFTVQPLPSQSVPKGFGGAVGSFTLTASAGPTNVGVGDPVTLKVQLTGHGALDSMPFPEQEGWQSFKTYPPTSKIDATDPVGLQGTKTFEQVVVPQNADIKELPQLTFSFFDPDQKAYRTLTQPALPLIVRPGGVTPQPAMAKSSGTSRTDETPSQDIVHIKLHPGALAQISTPLIQRPWFIAMQTVPFLAFVSAFVWRKRTDRLANNPRLRRKMRVDELVRNGLLELPSLAAARDSDRFFASVFRLLQERIGERLNVPASAITEAVIENDLKPANVPLPVLETLSELFEACNRARFAPVRSTEELAAFVPKTEQALKQLAELDLAGGRI